MQWPVPFPPLNTFKSSIFTRLNLLFSSTTLQKTFPQAPLPRGSQYSSTTTTKDARKPGYGTYPVARRRQATRGSGNPFPSLHPCHSVTAMYNTRHLLHLPASLPHAISLRGLATAYFSTPPYVNIIPPAPPSNARQHIINTLRNNTAARKIPFKSRPPSQTTSDLPSLTYAPPKHPGDAHNSGISKHLRQYRLCRLD